MTQQQGLTTSMETYSIGELISQLNGECDYYSERELRKILSKRHDLKQFSQSLLFTKAEAKKIFRALVGREFNDYQGRQHRSDRETGGPIVRIDHSANLPWIRDCFEKMKSQYEFSGVAEYSIGFICQGGFLSNANNEPFYFAIGKGVNILIGDRGTGKSTVLNLISALCDSPVEKTGILVREALQHQSIQQYDGDQGLIIADPFERAPKNALEKSEVSLEIPKVRLRRIREILRAYDVTRFVSVFHWGGVFYAFYMEAENGFDVFSISENWKRTPEGEGVKFPIFPVFRQGDIFRISDSDDRFAFNQVLDALNPTLSSIREEIVAAYKGLLRSRLSSEFPSVEVDHHGVSAFITEQFAMIDHMRDIRSLPELVSRVVAFVNEVGYQTGQYPFDRDKVTIMDVLRKPGDHAFFFVYGTVRRLMEKNIFELKMFNVIRIGDELFNRPVSSDAVDQAAAEATCRDLVELARQRIVVLQEILSTIRNCPKMDAINDKTIRGIRNLFGLRADLITVQSADCERITDSLKDMGIDVEIKNDHLSGTDDRLEENIELLDGAKSIYHDLINSSVFRKISEIRPLGQKMTKVSTMLRIFEFLAEGEKEVRQKEIAYVPVAVRLRQGLDYRSFEKLSFGQKAGIILMAVIKNTSSKWLLIDQPEDHLDVDTTINFLAPTLMKVAEDKSILIATHSENLVFRFMEHRVAVMHEEAGNGYISAYGNMKNEDTVSSVLLRLAGGRDAFCEKMRVYDNIRGEAKCPPQ